jgi:hypothetical protein
MLTRLKKLVILVVLVVITLAFSTNFVGADSPNNFTRNESDDRGINIKLHGAIGDGTFDNAPVLNIILSSIGTDDDDELFIPKGTYRISSNIIIPQNVNVTFAKGAMLSIDNGITVTINSEITAGLFQIFGGEGTVAGVLENKEVYPQWWGAKGNGTHDDTAAIQEAVTAGAGSTVVFSKPSDHYFVTNTITVPESHKGTKLIFAGGNNPSSNSKILIGDTFPSSAPVFDVSRGTLIEGLTIYYKTVSEYDQDETNDGNKVYHGIGIKIGNKSSNTQAVHINNCSFQNLDTAIVYGGNAYYNSIENCQFMQCNYGIIINATVANTGGYKVCGSLEVKNAHFWHNKEAGVSILSWCNHTEFNNCIFETNKYHVYSKPINQPYSYDPAAVSFNKCYFGDGCKYNIFMDGDDSNKVNIVVDGRDSQRLNGAGAASIVGAPDSASPSYGIKALTGYLTLKNLILSNNIYGSNGLISPTRYCGSDIYSENAVIKSENVRYEGQYIPKFASNDNNRCEEIPNYVINGMFNRQGILDQTLDLTNFNFSVLGKNGVGGNNIKLAAPAAAQSSVKLYYYAPHLVGKVAYLGAFIGDMSMTNNIIAINPANVTNEEEKEFDINVDRNIYPAYGRAQLNNSRIQPFAGKIGSDNISYYTSFYAPVLIKKPYGQITLRLINNAQAGTTFELGGVFLTDQANAGKLARFKDAVDFMMGTAPPTTGTYKLGDKITNTNPTAGGYQGWTCITAGTPGIWKGFGLIQN